MEHAVEVDLGAVSYVLMKPIYGPARGERVKRSMDITLANLKRAAEQRATAPA